MFQEDRTHKAEAKRGSFIDWPRVLSLGQHVWRQKGYTLSASQSLTRMIFESMTANITFCQSLYRLETQRKIVSQHLSHSTVSVLFAFNGIPTNTLVQVFTQLGNWNWTAVNRKCTPTGHANYFICNSIQDWWKWMFQKKWENQHHKPCHMFWEESFCQHQNTEQTAPINCTLNFLFFGFVLKDWKSISFTAPNHSSHCAHLSEDVVSQGIQESSFLTIFLIALEGTLRPDWNKCELLYWSKAQNALKFMCWFGFDIVPYVFFWHNTICKLCDGFSPNSFW